MSLYELRLGPINNLQDATRALRDVEQAVNRLTRTAAQTHDPAPAGGIQFLVRETSGEYHLWTLDAGAGTTLTLDSVNRIATLTAP